MNTIFRYAAIPISLLMLFYFNGCAKSKIAPSEPNVARSAPEAEKPLKKLNPLPSAGQRIWFVSSEKLHLRVCAGLNCQVSATLHRGDELFQTGEKGDWIRVRVKTSRKEGWVFSNFLRKEPPPILAGSWPPRESTQLK